MIVEGICNVIFGLLSGFFSLLPDIHWNIQADFFTKFLEVPRMVCYLLPMGTVATIFALVVAFTVFRIVVALVKTIWNLIPFL